MGFFFEVRNFCLTKSSLFRPLNTVMVVQHSVFLLLHIITAATLGFNPPPPYSLLAELNNVVLSLIGVVLGVIILGQKYKLSESFYENRTEGNLKLFHIFLNYFSKLQKSINSSNKMYPFKLS